MARLVDPRPFEAADGGLLRYVLAYPAVGLAVPTGLLLASSTYAFPAFLVVLACSGLGFFHYTGNTYDDHVCMECGEFAATDPGDHAIAQDLGLGPRGVGCLCTAAGAVVGLAAFLHL